MSAHSDAVSRISRLNPFTPESLACDEGMAGHKNGQTFPLSLRSSSQITSFSSCPRLLKPRQ